jgi:outer membrane murein-binding lipoprotein Lpp
MEQDGIPLSIGIIIGAAILGALILAGLIVAAALSI